MESDNFLKDLSESQKELSERIFNLVVGRVLRRAYLDLDEKMQPEMARIFFGADESAKEEFVKKYIPDFKKIFKEEAKNIEQELKSEIENKIEG
jgi:hypothetical protein